MYLLSVDLNPRIPFSALFVPVNTFEIGSSTFNSLIHHVLTTGAQAKIPSPVVETIPIPMVNIHPRWRVEKDAMH